MYDNEVRAIIILLIIFLIGVPLTFGFFWWLVYELGSLIKPAAHNMGKISFLITLLWFIFIGGFRVKISK